ncbi:MAG: transcription-repair coupling factor [Clostridia bacterium]|nr:transcription-repair coupling factor [Clostridia bacterium]
MKLITRTITADREFLGVCRALDEQLSAEKPLPISVSGLSDGASDAFLTELLRYASEKHPAPRLLFVTDEGAATRLAATLSAEGLNALYYPPRDFVFLNIASSHDTERERLSVLCRILSGEDVTVVTTPYAALQRTLPPETLSARALSLTVGDEVSPLTLSEKLTAMGFARTEAVEGVGQYARRGDILDVFPPDAPLPVRVEFFGDEVDRMSYFDPLTQRSEEVCPRLSLLPAKENTVSSTQREAMRLAHDDLSKKETDAETQATLIMERAALDSENDVFFADRYFALLSPEFACLLSYFAPEKTVCAVLSDSGMKEATETRLALLAEETTALVERGLLHKKYNCFSAEYTAFSVFLAASVALHVASFGNSLGGKLGGLFGFRTRRTVSYFDKPLLLREDIKTLLLGYYRVLVVAENAAAAEALSEALRAENMGTLLLPPDEAADYDLLNKGAVGITHGVLSSGFELMVPKIAVLSLLPDEAAARKRARRQVKLRRHTAGERILSHADLSVGDYVVHATHGIGIFEGMEAIRQDGVTKDYITIRYAGTDRLFLPADRLELISKYIGTKSEDGKVKLSKLGGGDWTRARSRAKATAKDMAKELVQLYAARQKKKGFAFPPACDMEEDFADSFEFEETASQIEAIREIESDMMRPIPMDRLLCGDVGFGKTEVALRAAFKAIVGGKQAAILVPTTILAMQHYQTALSRMRGYPVTIEMLSRLRSPKEQERVRRAVARGSVDLVIGTHSLLSKQVTFKDLGLLIVDEEQRFGVGQKEKLKALATDVDVLTLTATPIPRTLNMAMSGIRDMSVIDEAPADRHPVQTYVMEHNDVVIGEAIRKELARGGQVLYLYNRVETMERPLAKLSSLFPEARIAVAHGKMEKEALEDIWQSLVRGEIDLLLCTTIVETGVDLPNANTLIIEDADRMGLSQLHQLRGRVGRSGRHAYAYFTYRRGKELSEIAEKRLKAIREYAEFGAGFKIALRDLEIRGAGNLLGAEQHGHHIDAVGYDLYLKIFSEAVLEEKGVTPEEVFEAQIDLPCDAHIPERYVAASAHRMEMYKKISHILTEEDERDVTDELCDRFGEPPLPTRRLLWVALSRAIASRARIAKIEKKDGALRFLSASPDLSVWSELLHDNKNLRFAATSTGPAMLYRLSAGEDAAEALYKLMVAYERAKNNADVNKT